MRQIVLFSLIRITLWLVLWWALVQLRVGLFLAGVLAAFIAMLLSILFLKRPRAAAAEKWKAADDRRRERRGEPRDQDADEEDALLDNDM